MKYRLILCLAWAALPISAYANEVADDSDDRHIYVGSHIGINEGANWPAKVDFGSGVVLDGSLRTKAKLHAGAQLGYQHDHLRVEVEFQRGGLNVKEFSLGILSGADQGSINYSTLMVNGHRRVDITDKLGLTLGAGAGLARLHFPQIKTGTNCNCLTDFSKNGFAYQFRGGLEYKISETIQLVGQYNRLFLRSNSNDDSPLTQYSKVHFGVTTMGVRIKI